MTLFLYVFVYRWLVRIQANSTTDDRGVVNNLPVVVRFPKMVAPFKTCDPHQNSKGTYKVLSLNFDGEKDRPELRRFRELQEDLQRQLMLLCMYTEGAHVDTRT